LREWRGLSGWNLVDVVILMVEGEGEINWGEWG